MTLKTATLATPIGRIVLYVRDEALCGLGFDEHNEGLRRFLERRFGAVSIEPTRDPAGFVTRLGAYFSGEIGQLEDAPVDPGGTPFQSKVWSALRRIPAGRTWSYSQLAAAIGAPTAMRAVGLANGRNPIAIVIPCHRVIAADGTLGGYGGGLDRKAWLLAHERTGGSALAAAEAASHDARLPF